MIRWAVTGPTGAGKSLLTAKLADRGAAVVDGDSLGHEILARAETAAAVADAFGRDYLKDGRVDRASLGALVFADQGALERLNGLTHRPLAELAECRLEELEEAGHHVLAVFEAAVYFLLPSPPRMDLVITVTADPALRIARLAARTGADPETVAARVAAQADMHEAWNTADVVFDNGGDQDDLDRFANELWSRLP
jgi:dephospho-CoA kinase